MSRFIKLSSLVINSSHINKILIEKNKYEIHTISGTNDFLFFGTGDISNKTKIKICEKENPIDYKILTKWINECEKY